MNTRSLSFRLVAWYAGVLTIVFVLLGGLTILFLRHYLEANLLDIQMRRARQIADTLVAAASRSSESAMRGQVEALYAPQANERFIRITREGGAVVFSAAPNERFDPSQVPPLPTAAPPVKRKVSLADGALLIAATPATAADGTRYRVE